jgi:hypothetical protein
MMLWSRRRLPIIAPSYKDSRQSAVGSRQGYRVYGMRAENKPLGAGIECLPEASPTDAGLNRSYAFQRRKISNIEHGISNVEVIFSLLLFDIPCSIFDIQNPSQKTIKRAPLKRSPLIENKSENRAEGSFHRRVCPQDPGYKRKIPGNQRRTADYPLPTTHFFLDFPRDNHVHSIVCQYRGILNGSN